MYYFWHRVRKFCWLFDEGRNASNFLLVSQKTIFQNVFLVVKRILHSEISNVQTVEQVIKTNIPFGTKPGTRNDDKELRILLKLHPSLEAARKKNSPSTIYCIDTGLASFIQESVCNLKTNDDSSNSPIFEANPGPGLVTEALLKNSIKNISVFEKSPHFLKHLQNLEKQYPGRLEVVQHDLLSLPQLHAKQLNNSEVKEDELFNKLSVRHWHESPTVTIIAALSPLRDWSFSRFFLSKIPTMQSIFSYGRPEFFFILSENEYCRMSATEKDSFVKYRSSSVLYKLFFDVHLIEKIPKKCFLPDIRMPKLKHLKNEDYYFFVHVVPKADLFESVLPKEYLPDLSFFVKQSLISRKKLVLPTIEKWIPGSSPAIIKSGLGIGIFTAFGQLSPAQILELFQHILILPEYEESNLKVAARDSGEAV